MLRRALELGVTFIDTADSYGPGVSERVIREALHPYPDELVIATKAGLMRRFHSTPLPDGGRNHETGASLMSDLLDTVIEAHGGLERWGELDAVPARLTQGGALWGLKGQQGVLAWHARHS